MAFADRQEPAVTCAFPGGRASGGMLPPLPTNPGAAQKSLQQPQTQAWPASTSGGRKIAAGGPGGPGFGPSSTRIAGTGAANRPAANTTRSADATNSHAPSAQTSSPIRRNGSAGSNSNGCGRNHNTFDEGLTGNDPLRDAQRLGRASQPPLQQQQLQEGLGPYDPDQYDPGMVQERGLTEQPTGEELMTEENQNEEELLDMEPQQQQQQEEQALLQHNNPYLQILSQAGVAIGVGPYGGGLAAAAQAAHEVQQAALRKRVQRDIKRMLARNRAYQQHVKGPPALSAESLAQLAQPKQRPGSQPDPQVVANLPDPVEWARWKTDQLVISRLAEERRQAEHAEEKRRAEEQLAAFRQHKMEAKQAQAEAKARKAAEDAAYRANMSAYLNHKGALELEDFVKRKEEQRERLSLMRSRQVKALSAHHY
ncbi:hypothetical protein Vafri_5285 [Volvox africanus]|uniref:Uncharacterized protein n=1 Tax=Volvox africanus TaxID=51714 RepID=A0A8J4AW67_9CHLO|nr:hypothetical protein Vafri_5285 [Volvox africanus]